MGLRLGVGSFVNNDTVPLNSHTVPWLLTLALHGANADCRCRQRCADCGLRTQVRSNCWIRGLAANGFFLFRGRDVAVTMNSVKILHAVRSAITAIAELFVVFFYALQIFVMYVWLCVCIIIINYGLYSKYRKLVNLKKISNLGFNFQWWIPACAANISGVLPSLSARFGSMSSTVSSNWRIGMKPQPHAWLRPVCIYVHT